MLILTDHLVDIHGMPWTEVPQSVKSYKDYLLSLAEDRTVIENEDIYIDSSGVLVFDIPLYCVACGGTGINQDDFLENRIGLYVHKDCVYHPRDDESAIVIDTTMEDNYGVVIYTPEEPYSVPFGHVLCYMEKMNAICVAEFINNIVKRRKEPFLSIMKEIDNTIASMDSEKISKLYQRLIVEWGSGDPDVVRLLDSYR
jgi:hypothetical protein